MYLTEKYIKKKAAIPMNIQFFYTKMCHIYQHRQTNNKYNRNNPQKANKKYYTSTIRKDDLSLVALG